MTSGFKYLKVREKLLADAEKTANYRLPSERELCKLYQVSRNTAKKALNSLYDDQLVTRTVGRGTFLVPSKVKTTISIVSQTMGWQIQNFFENECKAFSKQHPNVEINIVTVKHGDMMKTARSLPGTKIVMSPNIGYMAEYGFLAPLDEMNDFQELSQEINGQYLDWFKFHNSQKHCYSIPLFLGVNMCQINKTHARTLGLDAERGPKDIQDLMSWLKCVDDYNTQAGATKIYGTHMYKPEGVSFRSPPISFYLTLASGKSFIQEKDGAVSFEFDSGYEWIELFKNIAKTQSICYSKTQPHVSITGETLFNYEIGQWSIRELSDINRLDDIVFTEFPAISSDAKSYASASKYSMAVIEDGQEDHPSRKMAWEFMKYLVCDPNPQRKIGEFFTAVNKTVFAEQTRDPQLYPFIQALSTSVMRNDHPVQHSIMKIVRKYFYDAVFDKMSIEDAVSRINEMCKLQIEIEAERGY